MKCIWTIIGVEDVPHSYRWYQRLFGQAESAPAHEYFGRILGDDGRVILCLHSWGEHGHPSLRSPNDGKPGNGLLLYFLVDDFDAAVQRARQLVTTFEEGPVLNPRTGAQEVSLRDPDGYFMTLSAFVDV